MLNTIRCCISCILPCGALDVIRIVHSNGQVEEISGSIRAETILKAHPKHVLRKPTSPSDQEILPKFVIVPPEAELQRGKLYFLMPVSSSPQKVRSKDATKKKMRQEACNTGELKSVSAKNIDSDRYLTEIMSEKVSTQRERKVRGRVAVWRPRLESIAEYSVDNANF